MHAFGDDALGELDAVAVADAIKAGAVSRAALSVSLRAPLPSALATQMSALPPRLLE